MMFRRDVICVVDCRVVKTVHLLRGINDTLLALGLRPCC